MTEQEYKNTRIGKIPEEWEVVRLGDIVSLEYGKGLPETKRIEGEYPVYGSNGIVGYHSKPLVKGPGIIIGRKGTMGAVSWADSDFWPIDTTYFIKAKRNDIFLKWLFSKLVSLNLKKLTLSDVVPGLNRNEVYSMKLPLPPLPEQRKIAEILSTVDEAIQKTEEIIQKTQELKKGLMQQLLTRGIGHTKFKQTEIGEIPEEWKVARLGEVLEFIKNGLTYRQTKDGNGYPLTRIETISDGVIDKTKVGYSAELTEREIESYKLKLGDILLSHINSVEHIGKTAIYEGDPPLLIHGMNLLLLRVSEEKALAFFLIQYFKWNVTRNRLRLMAKKAVNQASINQTELKSVLVPLPPLAEQQKIAEILSTVDEKIEVERRRKEKLEELKKGLMQVLLTGKVRVREFVES